jgi:hypothetical protein
LASHNTFMLSLNVAAASWNNLALAVAHAQRRAGW